MMMSFAAMGITAVVGALGHKIPELAFVMFQITFAIITVALLSGAIADRAKYSAWVIFVIVWITLVYSHVAAFSLTATFIIAKIIAKTIGFRVSRDVESEGLDTNIHAESAYEIR